MKNKLLYTPDQISNSFIPWEIDGSHLELRSDLKNSIEEYAKECCQVTFNKILDEITPFLKSLDGGQYHAVVNAFLHTDPILP